MDDSPEILAHLKAAMGQVRSQRVARTVQPSAEGDVVPAGAEARDATILRRQMRAVAELMSQRSLFLGDVAKTARRVDEAAATSLNVERVSVWMLDARRTKITCLDLFERSPARHSSGIELYRKDCEPYFAALEHERTIAAHDAHRDRRTSCFSASYLKPLGIESMLDVPISARGAMAGVVCHEHVGSPRKWNSDEESFGYLMATIIALSIERRQ